MLLLPGFSKAMDLIVHLNHLKFKNVLLLSCALFGLLLLLVPQLVSAVASALSQASQLALLPPLLVLQRLLRGGTDYGRLLSAAAAQSLAADSPNSE
jgi:hypothetical protein